jgi:hypothetical protein
VGRTSRIALIALVTATVLGGCSGGSEPGEPPPEQLAAAAENVQAAADFCEAARANVEAGQALTDFAAAGTPPRPEEEISAVTGPVRDSNEQMLAAAPEEVRLDAELLAELAELQLAAFEASGGDPAAPGQDPAYVEKAQTATEPAARFQSYLRARCRIDAT